MCLLKLAFLLCTAMELEMSLGIHWDRQILLRKGDRIVSFVVRQKTVAGRRKKKEEFIPCSYLNTEIQLKDIISE